MYREIKKKVLILNNRKPYSEEITSYIGEMNQMDWITSCLRLSGMPVTQESVQKIIKGELLIDISLKNHQLIHRYVDVLKQIQNMREMGTELTEKGLLQLYEILFEPEPETDGEGRYTLYRRNNPVLVEWAYNPPHFNDVKEQMDILFQWLAVEQGIANPDMNPIHRAAALHNKMVEIYPFGENSVVMARVSMLYELMTAGFPPPRLTMSEQEYNGVIVLYLKKEDNMPLYDAVLKGVYNQLELMVQLTAIQ